MTPADLAGAACIGVEPEIFYATKHRNEDTVTALAICRGCSVRQECLDATLAHEDGSGKSRHGVAGGLTALQRARVAKGKPPARELSPHGTTNAYRRHSAQGTPKCEPCKAAMSEYSRANWAARKVAAA